jgi:hypothetical protein
VDTLRRSMLVFGGVSGLRRGGYWPAYERLVDTSGRQRAYGDYFGYTFIVRGQAEAMIDIDLALGPRGGQDHRRGGGRPLHRLRRPAAFGGARSPRTDSCTRRFAG